MEKKQVGKEKEIYVVSTEMVLSNRDESNTWYFDNEEDAFAKYQEIHCLYEEDVRHEIREDEPNIDDKDLYERAFEMVGDCYYIDFQKIETYNTVKKYGEFYGKIGQSSWPGIMNDIMGYAEKSPADVFFMSDDEIRKIACDYKLGAKKFRQFFVWVEIKDLEYIKDWWEWDEIYYIRGTKALVFEHQTTATSAWELATN